MGRGRLVLSGGGLMRGAVSSSKLTVLDTLLLGSFDVRPGERVPGDPLREGERTACSMGRGEKRIVRGGVGGSAAVLEMST